MSACGKSRNGEHCWHIPEKDDPHSELDQLFVLFYCCWCNEIKVAYQGETVQEAGKHGPYLMGIKPKDFPAER